MGCSAVLLAVLREQGGGPGPDDLCQGEAADVSKNPSVIYALSQYFMHVPGCDSIGSLPEDCPCGLRGKLNAALEQERELTQLRADRERERAWKEQVAALLPCLVDEGECWFDHHGGCQEHAFLSLQPGEKCPQAELKELVAALQLEDPPGRTAGEPDGEVG